MKESTPRNLVLNVFVPNVLAIFTLIITMLLIAELPRLRFVAFAQRHQHRKDGRGYQYIELHVSRSVSRLRT